MNPRIHRPSRWLAVGLLALLLPVLAFATDTIPTVRTKTEAFTDVSLVSQTESHVFLKHARGVANVRIADLDNETLAALGVKGFKTTGLPDRSAPVTAGEETRLNFPGFSGPAVEWKVGLPETGPLSLPPREVLLMLLIGGGVFLALWLFFCWCAKLICDKAGSPSGLLIWIPILQMLPLLRAAGMSGWWLLGFLVPVLNIVAQILWSLNIARARGKGLLTGILLILPGTNIFAFLYLAFSSAGESAAEPPPTRPVFRMEPLPSQ